MGYLKLTSNCAVGIFTVRNEVAKVMFLQVSVMLSTGELCYPSMHCRWYPSMPCSRSPEGGVQVHTKGGSLGGSARGMPAGGVGCGGVGVAFCCGLLLCLLLWPSRLVAFWLNAAFWYGLLGGQPFQPEGHHTRRLPHQKATTPESTTPEGHHTRRPPH